MSGGRGTGILDIDGGEVNAMNAHVGWLDPGDGTINVMNGGRLELSGSLYLAGTLEPGGAARSVSPSGSPS